MHPLGVREPFLAPGVDEVIRVMKVRYPELEARGQLVRDMITAEEERFLDTLELGMSRLESLLDSAGKKKSKRIAGADVFQLYDTYGFPPELTGELAEERGIALDHGGFAKAMEGQKERARKSAVFHGGADDEEAAFTKIGDATASEFVGYDALECEAQVSGVRPAKTLDGEGPFVEFTTDRTVFYPEGGGQVGDVGAATFGDERLEVVDTYRVENRTFQALRHRAADMFCELELARSVVREALTSLDEAREDLLQMASAAKARCSDVASQITREAIQMHGGIGTTDEEEIGLFFKRAKAAELTLGDAIYHRDRYAALRGF